MRLHVLIPRCHWRPVASPPRPICFSAGLATSSSKVAMLSGGGRSYREPAPSAAGVICLLGASRAAFPVADSREPVLPAPCVAAAGVRAARRDVAG